MREDVPSAKLRPLVIELEQRCGGSRQAERYAGVSRVTFWHIREGKREFTQKTTARLIILALYQRRKEDSRRNGTSEQFRRARLYQAMIEERIMRGDGCG